MAKDIAISNSLFGSHQPISSPLAEELESWVVNTVKVKMIKKLDHLLEKEGKVNSRQLFLVPLFTISELKKRVEETAPEIKTFFYKELVKTIEEAEGKFASIS